MEQDEIKQLAVDIRAGKVFGSWCVEDPEMVSHVFMPLTFMSPEQREEFGKSDVAHIYEYIREAGPRSINGLPCFFSFKRLSREEVDALAKVMDALAEAEKAVLSV